MAEGGTAVQGLTILEGEGKTGDGGSSSKTVEVRGFSLDTSPDLLEMYFENTRRSGGGDLEEIEIKEDVAYITFEEPEVVQRVISHSPHQVAGQTLSVTVFCPPPQKACYENRVLVQRLNSAITEELLTNFLETETGMKVTEYLYGVEEGKVVVTFSDCIDFTALRKSCNTRRLQGTFLQVTKVAISNCIFVKDLQPSASHDVILFFFENKRRSGGGDVERVEMNIAERYCLVYFEDHNVIDTVLCQQHKIDGTDIEVHLHHECLGRRSSRNRLDPCLRMSKPELKENLLKAVMSSSISSNPDVGCDFVETPLKAKTSSSNSSNPDTGCDFVETPKWQEDDGKNCVLPLWIKYKRASERTIVKDIKKIPCSWNFYLFWNFFTKTKQGQNMLDDILKKYGCSVTVSSDDDDLFIFEISEESFETKSDLIDFIKDTLGNVYACAQQSLFSDIFLVDHRMLEDILQRVKQTKEMDSAWIGLVGEQESDAICVVCTEESKVSILRLVAAINAAVQDCFENHEDVVTVDPMWQKVLTKFGYLQQMSEKFPNLIMTPDETKSTILLKGARDQSKAAADHLMELLGIAQSEVKEDIFSPGCQFEIFTYPEMCDYIDNSIIKLPIVCIPNHLTKKLHLFSKMLDEIMGMDKFIKGCIKERPYLLTKEQTVCCPKIVSSLEELKKKHNGKIVINQSPTGIILTTTDDIFESVDAVVQEIIKTETGQVQPVVNHDKKDEQSVSKVDHKTSEKQRKTEELLQSDTDVTSEQNPKDSIILRSEPGGNIGHLQATLQPEVKAKSSSDVSVELEYKMRSDVKTLELSSKSLIVEHPQPQEVEFLVQTGKLKESVGSSKQFAEYTQLLETSHGNFGSSVRPTEIRQEFSWSKDASEVEVFYTKENIKVAVYMADIRNLPVDCIVNATNDKLQHGGGVAKAIADAAGPLLVQEGDAIIRKKGNVPVGCQVTTTAGRLPYRCVIHTVGPCWSDYQPYTLQKVKECEEDLYRAIYGCFLEAEKHGLSTVALPAVSSGIYAVPQDMCAVQYVKAVLDYSRKSRQELTLKEIHFIDKLPHLVKLMQDTFRTMIKNGKVPNYNIQNYVSFSSSYQRQHIEGYGMKGCEKQDVAVNNNQYETTEPKLSPVYYEPVVSNKKYFGFQISVKPVVHIYEGDILKLKHIDAVVFPDDSVGSGVGRIATELMEKTKYRQNKDKCFKRQKPNPGEVVITYGEETPFNVIVHVVIENNCSQKLEFKSTIQKSIDNILRKTNECMTVKTIALPLFGVKPGILTEKSWAVVFLERFVAFCCEVRNPNLEEVYIITHLSSSSAFSTVKKVFIEYADKFNKASSHQKWTSPRPPSSEVYRTCDDPQDLLSGQRHKSKNEECDTDDNCTICMCPKTDPKALSCGHSFCSECLDELHKHKPVCPICGKIVGALTGDQPKDGTMAVKPSRINLAGCEKHGSIVITYDFPAGRQGPDHPSPGAWYGSLKRTAYLPDTPEGKKVCRMLQLAFERRLVFTISTLDTGKEGLTWNDIHHKTNPNPGTQNGFPDPDYLSRVKDELASKGITEADLPPE